MPDQVIERTTAENMQKYENYKEQFGRLKKALSNGFYLEAMFIEYAVLEDRTESVLRHAELWDAYIKSRKGREPNIDSKIKFIQKQAENQKNTLHKYFSDDLLSDLLAWKNERNRLIHALLKQQFLHNEISELANRGNELITALRKCSGNFNRAVDKQKAAVQE